MVVGAWPRAHPCALRDRPEDLERLTPGPQPLRVSVIVAWRDGYPLLIGKPPRSRWACGAR